MSSLFLRFRRGRGFFVRRLTPVGFSFSSVVAAIVVLGYIRLLGQGTFP